MKASNIQKNVALVALFFMPLSALNLGVSVTVGDCFLLLAVLLNLKKLATLRGPQVWFLMMGPMVLISTLLDQESTWISVVQAMYIYGFVVPFGWCAFVDLSPTQLANTLILSGVVNGSVALAQFAGLIPPLPTQQIVEYFGGRMVRVAGLGNAVNELTQSLAPLFALLPILRPRRSKTPAMLFILAGLAAAVSKQAVFGCPGFAWYLYREGWKRWFIGAAVVSVMIGLFMLLLPGPSARILSQFADTVEYRKSYSEHAVEERFELLYAALELIPKCVALGYGHLGSLGELQRHGLNHFVHVYLIGLAMVGGIPAAILWCFGTIGLLRKLNQLCSFEWSVYLIVVVLGLQCHTVVMLSWQSLPLMIAGALVLRKQPSRVTNTKVVAPTKRFVKSRQLMIKKESMDTSTLRTPLRLR